MPLDEFTNSLKAKNIKPLNEDRQNNENLFL